MKKIKGGKRIGAGRKKTGRKTKVLSFSVPIERVDEVNELVKGRLANYKKVVAETPKEVKEFVKEGMNKAEKQDIQKQISEYETELKNLGEGRLGRMRKSFVENKIRELKKQL